MKLIISQDKQQIFTCGDCQMYSVGSVELPAETAGKAYRYYSVGVAGMSMGLFKCKEKAADILKDIAVFLGGKDTSYSVPADNEADAVEVVEATDEDESGTTETVSTEGGADKKETTDTKPENTDTTDEAAGDNTDTKPEAAAETDKPPKTPKTPKK